MTTKKSGLPSSLLLPIMGKLSESLMEAYAEKVRPDFGHIPNARAEGFNDMHRSVLTAHIHEQGHAHMMLHLDPNSDPEVIVDVTPTLAEEGVGVKLEGGRCGTAREFTPHERVMVSVAGWLAENVALTQALADILGEDAPPAVFANLDGGGLASLWLTPKFAESFNGCAEDHKEVLAALRDMLPDDAMDAPEGEAREAIVNDMRDKATAAFDAAIRYTLGAYVSIIQTATEDANKQCLILVEATTAIGAQMERVNGAAVGCFTPEAIAAKLAARGKRKAPVREWTGGKQ